MSPFRRNTLVGIVVVTALLLLGWMILKFGDRPAKLFATSDVPIHVTTDRADGISEGSPVYYRGVTVGRVTGLRRMENQREVVVDAEVDEKPPLPSNVWGVIRSTGLIGSASSVSLELTG